MEEDTQLQEQEQEAVEQPAEQSDTLFDTLFAATEEEEESGPDLTQALTISEALESEPEPLQQEVTEEVAEETSEAVAEESAPTKKKVRRIVKKEVVDPAPDAAEPPPAEPQPTQAEQEDPFVDELIDSEREFYDMAKFAEANMGQRGMSKQYLDFFKKHKEYLEKRRTEDPHFDASEDEQYQRFIGESSPRGLDVKKVREEMLLKRAEERAMSRLRPQVEQLQQQLYVNKVQPQVEAAQQRFLSETSDIAVPEDLLPKLKEGGAEKLKAENPLEFDIINAILANTQTIANEFISMAAGLSKWDEGNHVHQAIDTYIDKRQSDFIAQGTSATKKDGKDFMRRENFYNLTESEQQKYWTWSNDDILQFMKSDTKEQVAQHIQAKRDELSAYMKGHGQQTAPPPAAEVAPTPTPQRPAPSPRPGGVPQQAKDTKDAVLSVLGI